MSKSKGYHHGDLKSALVDAALDLLEDGGETSVSLRAIARRVGVSQTAPYSHFQNKADLLASVAAAGFKKFSETMAKEAPSGSSANEKRLAFGVGYVEFALNNPALFRLMFSKTSRKYFERADVRTQASASYRMLEGVISQLQANSADSKAATSAAWAIVHGLAELMLEGQIATPTTRGQRREFVRKILTTR